MKKSDSKNFNNILKITIMGMLTALSIVSLYFIKFPIIPAASFLEYDCADIPVLLGSLILGPVYGLAVLIAVCLIQAFTVSAASGWIGFLMHLIASSVLILIPGIVYKKKKSIKALSVSLIISVLLMTAVMIPLNLIFTGIFLGAGTKAVVSMLIPAIIPFNLLKGAINAIISFIVFIPLKKSLSKQIH